MPKATHPFQVAETVSIRHHLEGDVANADPTPLAHGIICAGWLSLDKVGRRKRADMHRRGDQVTRTVGVHQGEGEGGEVGRTDAKRELQ
jgi:hypothetical protein